MKTAKTPYLPTWAFTEGTVLSICISHALCATFSSPDLDNICAPIVEHVKRGGVPKGITAERHWCLAYLAGWF